MFSEALKFALTANFLVTFAALNRHHEDDRRGDQPVRRLRPDGQKQDAGHQQRLLHDHGQERRCPPGAQQHFRFVAGFAKHAALRLCSPPWLCRRGLSRAVLTRGTHAPALRIRWTSLRPRSRRTRTSPTVKHTRCAKLASNNPFWLASCRPSSLPPSHPSSRHALLFLLLLLVRLRLRSQHSVPPAADAGRRSPFLAALPTTHPQPHIPGLRPLLLNNVPPLDRRGRATARAHRATRLQLRRVLPGQLAVPRLHPEIQRPAGHHVHLGPRHRFWRGRIPALQPGRAARPRVQDPRQPRRRRRVRTTPAVALPCPLPNPAVCRSCAQAQRAA